MDLTILIKQNNEKAFEQAFNYYHPKLYSFLLKKSQSEYIAEELAQETFIKLWKYRNSLSTEFPLSSQIFRIAKTLFIDRLRKKSLLYIALSNEDDYSTLSMPENQLLDKELSQKINTLIGNLPKTRRKVFLLSREAGLSHSEIAKLLSISPKSVNNHITKAIKEIKIKLVNLSIFLFILYNLLRE